MSISGKHYYRFVYLKSEDWANKRLHKLASVDATCKICKHRDLSNDVHHITYRNLKDVRMNDLVVLCRRCHEKVHEVLKSCTEILDAEKSRDRWRMTMKKFRVRERESIVSYKPGAIKLWRKIHRSFPALKKPKYRKLYQFIRKNPNPSNSDWIVFCGVNTPDDIKTLRNSTLPERALAKSFKVSIKTIRMAIQLGRSPAFGC